MKTYLVRYTGSNQNAREPALPRICRIDRD
jgi:hypothetical protein